MTHSSALLLAQSWVGILLMKQPFFIGGIDNVETAKGSAFGAAATFFFTFLVSISLMIRDARRLARDGGDGHHHGNGEQHQFSNPFSRGLAFHDYDPVETDTPREFESGGVLT